MKSKSQQTRLKFEMLFKEHYPMLCMNSFSIVKNHDIAKDIVQDFFICCWQKKESIPKILNFKAYSSKAVKNLCIKYIRKSKKEKSIFEALNLPKYSEPIFVDQPAPTNKAHELLKLLPEKRRNIFLSSVIDGQSYSEIAKNNDISINTVKTQMKRAYSFLRIHATEDMLHLLFFISIISV